MRRYDDDDYNDYDLTTMVAKPLYFGMLVNIVLPGALLFACYYIEQKLYPENRIPNATELVFYIFAAIAVTQAGLALWLRNKWFNEPMVRKMATFEKDVQRELMARSKPIFLLIASISLWGFILFYLIGEFPATMAFVLVSFVVFQVVRPRYGTVRKILAHQKKLAEQGQFMKSGVSLSSHDLGDE